MVAYNPCYCWNLKDGCITIGIWSLLYCLAQVALNGWQTYIIRLLKDIAANKRLGPDFGVWAPDNPRWPGYYEEYWMNDKERFYLRIFIVQILNLIAAFFLLFASAALIYGVHTNSKHLVWPWFPCIVASIVCSAAYCIMWWAGNVESYWLVLTIVEFLSIIVNLYCLLCVIVQYRRIVKGYVQQTYDDEYKPKQLVYEYRPRQEVEASQQGDYYGEKKNSGYAASDTEQQQTQPTQTQKTTGTQYQPFYPYQTQQAQQQQAPPLPMKSQPPAEPASPEEPFKTRFTEAWIKGVNNVNPERPKTPVLGSSPERPFKRTKSVDALQDRGSRHRHHRMRSSKSKDSVSSRHSHRRRRRSRSSSSDSTSYDSDDDRDKMTERSGRRSIRSRTEDSDSDTGYSASVANTEQSARRSHRRSSRNKESQSKKHRKPRDVKRDDRERGAKSSGEGAQSENPPLTPDKPPMVPPRNPGHPAGGVPVLPMFPGSSAFPAAPPGAISIPQHIVIPPQPKGASSNQPQRYHINSEITIRYSDAQNQDPNNRRPSGPQPVSTTSASAPLTAPSPLSTASTVPIGQRVIDTSGDSKGYSSTAV